MYVLAGLKEPVVSTAKFITARKGRNQAKVLVEFVPDVATQRSYALRYRQPKAAMID